MGLNLRNLIFTMYSRGAELRLRDLARRGLSRAHAHRSIPVSSVGCITPHAQRSFAMFHLKILYSTGLILQLILMRMWVYVRSHLGFSNLESTRLITFLDHPDHHLQSIMCFACRNRYLQYLVFISRTIYTNYMLRRRTPGSGKGKQDMAAPIACSAYKNCRAWDGAYGR